MILLVTELTNTRLICLKLTRDYKNKDIDRIKIKTIQKGKEDIEFV